MQKILTFRFLYEDYVDFGYYKGIQEINHLVYRTGVCILFVNNIHYSLEAGMIVETKSNIEKIKEIFIQSGMNIDYFFGKEELFKCMNNQYNVFSLPFKSGLGESKMFVDGLFFLPLVLVDY